MTRHGWHVPIVINHSTVVLCSMTCPCSVREPVNIFLKILKSRLVYIIVVLIVVIEYPLCPACCSDKPNEGTPTCLRKDGAQRDGSLLIAEDRNVGAAWREGSRRITTSQIVVNVRATLCTATIHIPVYFILFQRIIYPYKNPYV